MKTRFYDIGDSCMCCSFGNSINEETSRFVLGVYSVLRQRHKKIFLDAVPSYNSIAVHYNPLKIKRKKIEQIITESVKIAATSNITLESKTIKIPLIYNGSDLQRISNLTSLDISDIIKLHREAIYTVAMIGFKAHFPYLLGLNPKLEVARHDSPRERVPEGSVAFAGVQCGIYPCETPGGWNIVGETKLKYFDMLNPGDKVIFEEVEKL